MARITKKRKRVNLLDENIKTCLLTFNKFDVQYLVVGGYAVNLHGYIRTTLDADIWIEDTKENLDKLEDCFIHLKYEKSDANQAVNELRNGRNLHVLLDESKLDLIILYSTILKFKDAFNRKKMLPLKESEIPFISYEDLIDTKLRTDRIKDWMDVQELKKINGK